MANVRIKDLTTTAATTASDDFFGVDGATNGTRKLNAFSPTFGGNLTLSGTTSTIMLGSTNTANVAVNSSGALTVTSANGQTLVSQTSSGAHYIEIKRASQSTGQVGLSLNGGTSGNTWLMYQPASSNTLTWFGNSANRMSLDTSGNLTLDTGNLTVSGGTITGGASGMSLASGGTNQNISITPSGTGSVAASSTAANVLTLLRDTTNTGVGTAIKLRQKDAAGTTVDIGDIYAYKSVATAGSVSSWIGFGTRNAGTLTDAMFIAPSGNVVLGSTATDSANGRLQLATHTTSAGGIGFGTDTSLYRTAAGDVSLDGPGGSDAILRFKKGGVEALRVESNVGSGYITASGTLYVRSGGSTALTLDSSQNATFAGAVQITTNASSVSRKLVIFDSSSANNTQGIEFSNTTLGSSGSSAYIRAIRTSSSGSNTDLTFGTMLSGVVSEVLKLDSSQKATFAGAIAINNTVQTAVGVASTHKVTISIGGSTYYLLATNV